MAIDTTSQSAETTTFSKVTGPYFWRLALDLPTEKVQIEAQQHDRLSISIVNIDEAHTLLRRFDQAIGDRRRASPIPPQDAIPIELEIRIPGYAPDYFFETGFHFVSARFRAAANFPDDAVQYLDAPCTRCTPEAKAKDYKVLWVHHFEDVLDRERSVILPADSYPERSSYVFRDDVTVSAPVFQLGLYLAVMLTDAAARRLAAEHLDGVAFEDMTRDSPEGPFVTMGD